MRKRMMLQLFEDGSGAGSNRQSGNAGTGNSGRESAGSTSGASNSRTYTYEQLEEIASARASKSERAALASFFRGQGMTEEEVTERRDYKVLFFREKRSELLSAWSGRNTTAYTAEYDSKGFYKKSPGKWGNCKAGNCSGESSRTEGI